MKTDKILIGIFVLIIFVLIQQNSINKNLSKLVDRFPSIAELDTKEEKIYLITDEKLRKKKLIELYDKRALLYIDSVNDTVDVSVSSGSLDIGGGYLHNIGSIDDTVSVKVDN